MDIQELLKQLTSPQVGSAIEQLSGQPEGSYDLLRQSTKQTMLDPILGGLETISTPSNIAQAILMLSPLGQRVPQAAQAAQGIPRAANPVLDLLKVSTDDLAKANAQGELYNPQIVNMIQHLLNGLGKQ